MNLKKYNNSIFHISNFFPLLFCKEIIKSVENSKILPNKVIKNEVDKIGSRNNYRAIIDNINLAKLIWDTLSPYHTIFSEEYGIPCGINEKFRFYKYFTSQKFDFHIDCSTNLSEQIGSKFSLLLYLNNDFTGGNTDFKSLSIVPKTGDLLLFPHDLIHSGSEVRSGIKYVLRSDVFFCKPQI